MFIKKVLLCPDADCLKFSEKDPDVEYALDYLGYRAETAVLIGVRKSSPVQQPMPGSRIRSVQSGACLIDRQCRYNGRGKHVKNR